MTVVLGALQAYRDIRPIVDRPDSFLRGDYLVLSKRVSALNAIGLGSGGFTPRSCRSFAPSLSCGRSGR